MNKGYKTELSRREFGFAAATVLTSFDHPYETKVPYSSTQGTGGWYYGHGNSGDTTPANFATALMQWGDHYGQNGWWVNAFNKTPVLKNPAFQAGNTTSTNSRPAILKCLLPNLLGARTLYAKGTSGRWDGTIGAVFRLFHNNTEILSRTMSAGVPDLDHSVAFNAAPGDAIYWLWHNASGTQGWYGYIRNCRISSVP